MIRYYRCPECGEFDDYRKDTEILKKCPKCDSMVNQILGGNFRLNCQGFYATDNKGK
jgi:putative FmdB family regulatory protein